MANKLEVIQHIIETHHIIRERVAIVGGSMNDLEALFNIRSEYADWSQASLDQLADKHGRMKESLASLEDGLNKHFDYEEENLPDILGKVLFDGLVYEHTGVRKNLSDAKNAVFGMQIDGTNRENLSVIKTHYQHLIDSLSRQIESHATREEVVLDLAREGLEHEIF